jgi:hypothetical protein
MKTTTMMTDLHPEVRELIRSEGHLEAFEKGELTLIQPVDAHADLTEEDFDAISMTEIRSGYGVYMFKEADPTQAPPKEIKLLLMKTHRWQLLKSRKELSIDFLENQGFLKRQPE